ncbi:peptidoglycan DD-metalloendopeptidase family protein [Mesonia sp. MT50]|uniref:Peptidoglycan DD-metalloendopeptidase family protein n=1 Tax=Mesonia profundi TaxID=3070998 RepID=A0ABU1A1D5_9FLAO|nr:peptidoglycan DD-metalloendopeptidase family protein [Mesonia profundi]MDQ7917061.1 peptidoglycan DD-metalloendopeptidase family protein [Mesonia profundi]
MNLKRYLYSLTPGLTRLVDDVSVEDYMAVDLSLQQKDLHTIATSSSQFFQSYIDSYLHTHKKKVAFGGYLEKRNLYNRSPYFTSDKENPRNIHLGLDIWCPENTAILLPLNGKIHSYQNNINHGDYGPTIMVEHQLKDQIFYTLYGHLSLNSLDGIKINCELQAGERLGYLDDAEVNGDYAPHLHFQIIRDLQGNSGDYPGVCALKDLEFYQHNCPDPNLLLKIV